MEQYDVTGMSCAACSARVEKAVSGVPGVTSCSVSLLTNSMGVEGTADSSAIIKAVEDAGYGASVKGSEKKADHSSEEKQLEDRETPKLKKRLIASLGFLIVLMYFSMGHTMWGAPVPAFFENNQRFQGSSSQGPQHGHTCCHGVCRLVCLERHSFIQNDGINYGLTSSS